MNLDPRILQSLLGVSPTGNSNGQVQEYIDPATGLPYTLLRNFAQGSGDAGMVDRSQLMPGEIVSPAGQKNELGYNLMNVYDQQGNFLRQDDDGSGFGAVGDFVGEYMGPILAALGTWGAATGFGGALGAAETAGAAGAGSAAGTGSITLPTMAEMGVGAATVTPELLATMPAVGAGGAAIGAGMGGSAGGLGTSGVNSMRAGEIANYATNGSMPSSAATAGGGGFNWGDLFSANNIGGLLSGVAGAVGSRDQTQTQSRDPWGPAQPLLQDVINQSRSLLQQYGQQPFSPLQRQAYNNQFGLLNAANQAAPGLLAGMQANAGGSNAYDRSNPRRPLTGSNPQFNWTPGLLTGFGG